MGGNTDRFVYCELQLAENVSPNAIRSRLAEGGIPTNPHIGNRGEVRLSAPESQVKKWEAGDSEVKKVTRLE